MLRLAHSVFDRLRSSTPSSSSSTRFLNAHTNADCSFGSDHASQLTVDDDQPAIAVAVADTSATSIIPLATRTSTAPNAPPPAPLPTVAGVAADVDNSTPTSSNTQVPGTEVERPVAPAMQPRPVELSSDLAEILFVLICSSSQLLFAVFIGDIAVLQRDIKQFIGVSEHELPWLQGSFMLTNGLSVLIAGSLADLTRPKLLVNLSFAWLIVWNLMGGVSIRIGSRILFFIVRAMQGLAIGALVSTTISMLGRCYQPGRRKNRAFSCMASTAPLGFWIGAVQGGALAKNPDWIFWSNALVCSLILAGSLHYLPDLAPAADHTGTATRPSIKEFDYYGAVLGLAGAGSLLFGLTQGTPAHWTPYTIITLVLGVVLLAIFSFTETRVRRPLVPTSLWSTPGFGALAISYCLGFGSYIAWQFYAVRFFLDIQSKTPLTTSFYLLPNAVVGVLAAGLVSRTAHIIPVHWLLTAAMIAFGLGPVFFLPQTAQTPYWALSLPGIILVTLGPDLSFAAASIFITSAVTRRDQGAAGSVLVTIQNLSAAVFTSISDAIGAKTTSAPDGSLALNSLRAIWWFNFAVSLVGALICVFLLRIPRTMEKSHAH